MRQHEDQLMAARNPALEKFKAKNKGQSFYPGKGMRLHDSFDGLCYGVIYNLLYFRLKEGHFWNAVET